MVGSVRVRVCMLVYVWGREGGWGWDTLESHRVEAPGAFTGPGPSPCPGAWASPCPGAWASPCPGAWASPVPPIAFTMAQVTPPPAAGPSDEENDDEDDDDGA